jgi:hypothetical protein
MSNLSFLKSGDLGNIGLKQLIEARQLTTRKWEETGMLDDLKGAMKENVAQLYENQAGHMLYESTVADASGSFETIAFPVIRRTFAKLLANELVSIQALQMPVGRLYFINPKISKRNEGAHSEMDGGRTNGAHAFEIDPATGRKVYNVDGDTTSGFKPSLTPGVQYQKNSMYDMYYATEYNSYGDSLFNATNGKIFAKSTVITDGVTQPNGATAKMQIKLTGFSLDNRGKLVGPVGAPADTEEFLSTLRIVSNVDLILENEPTNVIKAGSDVPFRILPQKYAQPLVERDGSIRFELDLTLSDSNGNWVPVTVKPNEDLTIPTATFTAEYSFYSDMEGDSEIAEVSFDFDFVTVDVGNPKKLRATYTPEAQQDVQAFQSVDVEAELISMLSETVSAEIDREILRDLRAGAAWSAKWDSKGYDKKILNGGVIGITRKDYNQELITEINKISARINKSTLRGGANWIVVSPEISAIFNDLEYFHATNAGPEETQYSLGIEKVGSLHNKMQVYVDVYSPANTILIGHKGAGIFHAGYIYAPYVPLMLFPKVVNPNDFRNVLGIMTRYAKKMVNNRFFGKIFVEGLDWMDPKEFLHTV